MTKSIEKKLWKMVEQEGLVNPSWVVELQDDDEPPLFTRHEQVEFLQHVPSAERGCMLLQTSLMLLKRIDDFIAVTELPHDQRIFCCATFTDFEEWREGEQLVPTPALYVRPHDERPPMASCSFVDAESINGQEVKRWLHQLSSDLSTQFCVVELNVGGINPDLRRVYVGWKMNPSEKLVSVGQRGYHACPK